MQMISFLFFSLLCFLSLLLLPIIIHASLIIINHLFKRDEKPADQAIPVKATLSNRKRTMLYTGIAFYCLLFMASGIWMLYEFSRNTSGFTQAIVIVPVILVIFGGTLWWSNRKSRAAIKRLPEPEVDSWGLIKSHGLTCIMMSWTRNGTGH
jgi:amino acid permease